MAMALSERHHGTSFLGAARVLKVAVLALLGLGLWLGLGPIQIGGSCSYVITDGVSMLPHFHANGLVITRKEKTYQVGEVVAYHNKQLGTVVMHRIVARDGDTFIFKGDNNNFVDSYHPAQSEIVGREWVYWPGAGKVFHFFRSPLVVGVVLATVGFFAFRGERRPRRRRRHAH